MSIEDRLKDKHGTSECSCFKCKSMCHTSPCFPTPRQVLALMEAGFSDKLMNTGFCNVQEFDRSTNFFKIYELIAPAAQSGHMLHPTHGKIKLERCSFLDENNMCILHNLGLKPLEGSLAKCDSPHDDTVKLRVDVCNTWNAELNPEDSVLIRQLMKVFSRRSKRRESRSVINKNKDE